MQEKFFKVRTRALRTTLLIIAFCTSTLFLFAQEEREEKGEDEKGFQKEKLFVGGNFGLTFGSYTLISIGREI